MDYRAETTTVRWWLACPVHTYLLSVGCQFLHPPRARDALEPLGILGCLTQCKPPRVAANLRLIGKADTVHRRRGPAR